MRRLLPLNKTMREYYQKKDERMRLYDLDIRLTRPKGRLNEAQRIQRDRELEKYLKWVQVGGGPDDTR